MARANIDYGLNDKKYPLYLGDVIFYFSSSLNRYKFSNRFTAGLLEMGSRIAKRYHGKLDCYWLYALYQYVEIEHRGFRIEVNGKTVRGLDALVITCKLEVNSNDELGEVSGRGEVGEAVQCEDSEGSEESGHHCSPENENKGCPEEH